MPMTLKVNKKELRGFVARLRELQKDADERVRMDEGAHSFSWEDLHYELTRWYEDKILPQAKRIDELNNPELFDKRIWPVVDKLDKIAPMVPGPVWDSFNEEFDEIPPSDANAEDVSDGELSSFADELEQLEKPIRVGQKDRVALKAYEKVLRGQADLIKSILKEG